MRVEIMGGLVGSSKQVFSLFDTGAESSNYIYGYFLDELKKHQKVEVTKVKDHVRFGDQKTILKIEEAAILDVRFEDPEDPHRVFHQKHVFKVIPLGVKPLERDTPVILGLVTTCCHYLDLMVRNIRHHHVRMREGLPTTDTLEAEVKRLNIMQAYDTLVEGETEGEVSGHSVMDSMINKVSHGEVLPEAK